MAKLLLASIGLLPVAGTASALPRPCAEASDAETIAAVVIAQRRFDAGWAVASAGRATHYAMKPQPRHPFAIGALAAPVDAADLPDGLVLADDVRCTTHEVAPDREIVVTFAGYGIRFHDAVDGWSRPLPYGQLAVFAIRTSAKRPSPRVVVEARTILPPEATLRHPASGLPPLPAAVSPSAARSPGRKAP